MVGLNTVAKSNEYAKELVKDVDDMKSKQDLEEFKNYYENASDEEKKALDEKFNTYFYEELQKNPKLKDKLNNIDESSEITKEDMDNLDAVRSLNDVLNDYPDISSPAYVAVRKMVDEYIKDLNERTKEVVNPENVEGKKVDGYN